MAILLGTFQGRRFLAQQLATIAAQTYSDWALWASDDGSTDGTLDMLRAFASEHPGKHVSFRRGPGRGFSANYLSLACDPAIEADYFAFSDQDDLWDPDKLQRAVSWMTTIPDDVPALYCARTRLIDEAGRDIGFSPLFGRPLSFRNALVQSVAGGNTMLFNRAARALLIEAGPDVDVQTHDWWAYIVTTGCGGRAFYDKLPAVGYRQHGANLVGSNIGASARFERAARLVRGKFRSMNDRNVRALQRIRHRLTAESRDVLDRFDRARNAWLLPRAVGVLRSGVYHHTRFGNLGLLTAILLKKL